MTRQAWYHSPRGKRIGRAVALAWRFPLARCAAILVISLMCCLNSFGYSVLAHEEIVDLLWKDEIRSLLLQRFPALTKDQLREAHAYAYGGAVIQDLGYYPFGNKQFSDLAHYVRSGDFVREMLTESRDANEYAFAMGALAHYASDIDGHPAVNQSVAILFPKLRAKFGEFVYYAQNRTAHIRTEFGFDVVQVAKNRYAPEQYHDFIGFQVAVPLLERVFPVVYGVDLKDVLPRENLTISSYRYSVSRLIPKMTVVALKAYQKEMVREEPTFSKRKFLYRLSRAGYEKEWGKERLKAGFGIRVLSALVRLVPKIGPLRALAFKTPTPRTEDLYFKSINKSVDHYRGDLRDLRTDALRLPDMDFDTGKATKAGEYSLADDSYAKLLAQLSERKFDRTSPELRQNILHFYADLSAPITTKKDKARWQGVLTSLDQLKAFVPAQSSTELLKTK
jgi:hypothetical protein